MNWRATRSSFDALVARAARVLTDSNVAVYPVDARGLTGVPMANAALGGPMGGEGSQVPLSIIHARQSMQSIADATGGRAFYGGNDLDSAIRRAIDDSATVYTLSYVPGHGKWDGRFRRIEVSVNREGVAARHRKGYFAVAEPAGEPAQQRLTSALWSPLEATGLGLAGSMGHKLELLVESDRIALEPHDGFWTGTLEFMLSQQSAEGKSLRATQFVLPLRVDKQTLEGSFRSGVGIEKDIELVPGATQLRVAVRDRRSGRIGTLTIPLKPGTR